MADLLTGMKDAADRQENALTNALLSVVRAGKTEEQPRAVSQRDRGPRQSRRREGAYRHANN